MNKFRTVLFFLLLTLLFPQLDSRKANAQDKWAELAGSWCDSEQGCTNWWSVYRIEVIGQTKLRIKYGGGTSRSENFTVFYGSIIKQKDKIEGIYVPPPPECSEAGRPRSKEEMKRLKDLQPDLREHSRAVFADIAKQIPEPLRRQKVRVRPGRPIEDSATHSEKKAGEGFAESEKWTGESPGELEHAYGKYMRKVTATISASAPYIITLRIPPHPILDHKCVVRKESPERTLKLEKQHDRDPAR